jgi:metal-responsive CopG/Arc/MetJ family transcriptional regulator
METVSIKFQGTILRKIDKSLVNNNYNSRSEFIRECVRNKLYDIEKNNLIKEFLKLKGSSKNKTNYKDNKKVKEIVSKELLKDLSRRFK